MQPYSPLGKNYPPPLEYIQNLFQEDDLSYQAIFFGHAHKDYTFKIQETLFFSPGSLGCSYNNYVNYGIVTVSIESGLQIEIKQARFDRESFLQLFSKKRVPDKENILKIFYGVSQ